MNTFAVKFSFLFIRYSKAVIKYHRLLFHVHMTKISKNDFRLEHNIHEMDY